MEATLRKRKAAGLTYNEQCERKEAEWFAAREATALASPATTPAPVRPLAYRLKTTGWVVLSGLVLLLLVFLFPPWLGVEQLPSEQDTVRAVGRRIIFNSPSPEFVRDRVWGAVEGSHPQLGKYYFAKIDYARWWTEMFVCVVATGAAVVVVCSFRRVKRG